MRTALCRSVCTAVRLHQKPIVLWLVNSLIVISFRSANNSGGRAAQNSARSQAYVNLAYRQLEWIMGANPFSACMMTGEGMRNPYPHSRFVGLIPGGIMNGIAGNANDEPILDTEYGFDWRTTEYWSPHNAWYIWTHSVLEQAIA